jgi:uncharacterized OB-fold protein
MPSCPYCGDRRFDIVEARGSGIVYSWVVVHMAFDPAFKDEVPYVLATVDLDDGVRVVARLEAPSQAIEPGVRVEKRFHDHAGWTELRFEQAQPGSRSGQNETQQTARSEVG